MKIILGLGKSKSKITNGVIAIGVFDGMHIGHSLLLDRAVKKARELNVKCIAITFWPHPAKTPVICSLRKRLALIAERGVDYCIIVPFTGRFSRIPARRFIKEIIAKRFRPRYLFVGSNFTFGRGAYGNVQLLKKMSRILGFSIEEVKIKKSRGTPISSTVIRELISRGKLTEASKFLGRDFTLEGKVISSQKRGRSLGFPTANIDYNNEVLPPDGVYTAEIMLKDESRKGICYIGRRPTFGQNSGRSVEVFIFDFDKNIYGRSVEIKPVKFIRGDIKFNSSEELISQIANDIRIARRLLK